MTTNWYHIIEGCKRQDARMQEHLYRHCYAGMIKVCLRYARGNMDDAGAMYNQAMLKVFRNVDQFKGEGEFEGWIRRIVVNTCIDQCRSRARFQPAELHESGVSQLPVVPDAYHRIDSNEIMALVHELPKNTGLVFNLFVMEGYRHEEIGQLLGISSGTSKWHLNEARRLLKQKLETLLKKDFIKHVV